MRQLTAYVENTAVHIVMVGRSSSTENTDLNVCFLFSLINTRFLWIIEFEWKIENKALFSPRLAAPSSPHILCTRGWIIGDARRFCVLCPVSSWFGIDTSSHDGTEPACWIDAHIGESWLHARHSRICSSILWKQWNVCCQWFGAELVLDIFYLTSDMHRQKAACGKHWLLQVIQTG